MKTCAYWVGPICQHFSLQGDNAIPCLTVARTFIILYLWSQFSVQGYRHCLRNLLIIHCVCFVCFCLNPCFFLYHWSYCVNICDLGFCALFYSSFFCVCILFVSTALQHLIVIGFFCCQAIYYYYCYYYYYCRHFSNDSCSFSGKCACSPLLGFFDTPVQLLRR
jgi:hypothetical protein